MKCAFSWLFMKHLSRRKENNWKTLVFFSFFCRLFLWLKKNRRLKRWSINRWFAKHLTYFHKQFRGKRKTEIYRWKLLKTLIWYIPQMLQCCDLRYCYPQSKQFSIIVPVPALPDFESMQVNNCYADISLVQYHNRAEKRAILTFWQKADWPPSYNTGPIRHILNIIHKKSLKEACR